MDVDSGVGQVAGVANAVVALPDRQEKRASIRFAGGDIASIDEDGREADRAWIDASGLTAIAGMIDLQTNGAFGFDCMSGDPADVARLAARLPEYGCTGFLPTIVTASNDHLASAARAIATAAASQDGASARILGIHLEGPWIGTGPTARGAHDPAQIRAFDADEWSGLQRAAGGLIRLVTLAPEPASHLDAIRWLSDEGMVISLGHTEADYEQVLAGVSAGATLVTHVYNAMRTFGHREPGAIGAALDDDWIVTTVIPDGVHVHPAAIRLLVRAKGTAGVIGVTDSFWCAGLPPGTYPWGSSSVRWDGVVARLPDGRLAGSTLTVDAALRNLAWFCNLRLPDAATMLTANPARALGLTDCGLLQPWRRADVVLLDDSGQVKMTLIGGRVAYADPRQWAHEEEWTRR